MEREQSNFFPLRTNTLAHKGFHLVQLQSHLSPMSLPRTGAGTIHQGEGSEGRDLQKLLSHLEALTKLLKLSGNVLTWTFFNGR